MRKFRDHSCFEQFLKAQVDEIKQYRTKNPTPPGCEDQSVVVRWIVEHAKDFRENYMLQHPNDFQN